MGQPSPFTSPSAPGAGSVAPKIYDLDGCLVAFSPTQYTAAGTGDNLTGYEGSPPRDRVTTAIFVLETPNGAPITFGGDPTKGVPPTHVVSGPARFAGVWISSQNIVAALAPGGQPLVGAMVLGRIRRSEVGRKPWNLVAVDGTPDMDRAIQIWSALQLGSLAYNEPTPLQPTPVAPPANSVQYGYAPSPVPSQPAAWTVPPVGQVGIPPVAGGPQGFANYPPAPVTTTPNPQWGDPNAANGSTMQPHLPVPQPPAPPAPPQPPTLPPHLVALGWTPQSWAGLTPEQQGQVLAATPVA